MRATFCVFNLFFAHPSRISTTPAFIFFFFFFDLTFVYRLCLSMDCDSLVGRRTRNIAELVQICQPTRRKRFSPFTLVDRSRDECRPVLLPTKMPTLDTLPAHGFTGRAVPAATTTTPNTTSSSTSSTRNSLQAKVTRLLSANLEDGATRAALDTLGQVELAESKRARTAASLSDPTPTAGEQGGAGISDALRRGGLRKEVDARMEQGSREFLRAFSEVNDASLSLSLLREG